MTGIGSTKRNVLGDTTLKGLSADEVALVMTYEMGHYRLRHSWADLILQRFAMLAGLVFIHISAAWILLHFSARTGVHELGDVASLPLFMLLFNLVVFMLMLPKSLSGCRLLSRVTPAPRQTPSFLQHIPAVAARSSRTVLALFQPVDHMLIWWSEGDGY